jgi:hypothetical protein
LLRPLATKSPWFWSSLIGEIPGDIAMSKRLVLSACAVVLLSASAVALPGVAVTTVNLRAESNTTSAVLAKMPVGARLDIGDCTGGWCAVTFQGRSGFAIQTALDASGRPRPVRRALPPGAGPDDDFEPVAPGYRPYPVAPPPVVYGPGPYFYGPGPYWGPRWGLGWGYGWRRW